MNKVCLMGRLTRDMELRTTANGKSVGNLTMAVDYISKMKMAKSKLIL
jgi:single-stranded DNA-binding protein